MGDGTFESKHPHPSTGKKGILTGTNITRLGAHLLNISICNYLRSPAAAGSDEPKVLEARHKLGLGRAKGKLFGPAAGGSGGEGAADHMSKTKLQELQGLFAMAAYLTNVPFNAFSHQSWIDFFAALRPAFEIPSRERLSNGLLVESYKTVEDRVKARMSAAVYVSITVDGWARNEASTHVLAACAAAPGFNAYLGAVAMETERMTAENIAAHIGEMIDNAGIGGKIAALVTDSPTVMVLARTLVAQRYQGIITLGCLAHALQNFLKEVAKLCEVEKVVNWSKSVVGFFFTHSIHNLLLQEKAHAHFGKKQFKGLVKHIPTRWGFTTLMMERLHGMQPAIMAAVHDARFPLTDAVHKALKAKIVEPSAIIMWANMRYLVHLFKPATAAIKILEGNCVTLGDAYWCLRDISDAISNATSLWTQLMGDDELGAPTDISSALYSQVVGNLARVWNARKEKMWSDVFILGALLDPKYWPKWQAIPQKERILAERIMQDMAGGPRTASGQAALMQLHTFLQHPEVLSIPPDSALGPAVTNRGADWWKLYGAECPQLAAVAERIMSIPPTSAASERNFSAWGNIWSDDRASLKVERVAKLVYIYFNERLMVEANETWTSASWDALIEELKAMPELDVVAAEGIEVVAEAAAAAAAHAQG